MQYLVAGVPGGATIGRGTYGLAESVEAAAINPKPANHNFPAMSSLLDRNAGVPTIADMVPGFDQQ
jgi:hypothetical protein